MLSLSNILCDHAAGNEALRYGHKSSHGHGHSTASANATATADPYADTPKPVVVWAVTQACNLKCVHCYAAASAEPAPEELTGEEARALLDDLKAFGVPAVLFSGGEPLVRPDILDLIRYASVELGMRCTLSTNGTLIDADKAKQLADLGLTYVGMSIDGTRPQHDKLRGMQGCFDQTVAAFKHCKDAGLRTGARFTVHGLNHHELDDIFDLCLEHNIDRLCVYHLAYAGRGGNMQKVDLTADQTRAIVDRIFERTRQAHDDGHELEVLTVGNHADQAYAILSLEQSDPKRAQRILDKLRRNGGNQSGNYISSIDPLGNVHYDQFSWHYNVGNIRENPFSDIWSSARDPRLAVLRDRKSHLPATCQQCRFLDICNGNLRTRAEAATTDWFGMDPSCYLTDQERLS